MSRFEGEASIRRALSMPNGNTQLDIMPAGQDWQWSVVPAERAREALACGLAAISGGWKVYVSLPDDPNSTMLEIFGLTKTPDRGVPVPPAPQPQPPLQPQPGECASLRDKISELDVEILNLEEQLSGDQRADAPIRLRINQRKTERATAVKRAETLGCPP